MQTNQSRLTAKVPALSVLVLCMVAVPTGAQEPQSNQRFELLRVFSEQQARPPCINDRGEIALMVTGGEEAGVWKRTTDGIWKQIAGSKDDGVPVGKGAFPGPHRLIMNERGDLVFVTQAPLTRANQLWLFTEKDGLKNMATFGRNGESSPIPDAELGQVLFSDNGKVTLVVLQPLDDTSILPQFNCWSAKAGQSLVEVATGISPTSSRTMMMSPSGQIVYYSDEELEPVDVLTLWSQGTRKPLISLGRPTRIDDVELQIHSVDSGAINSKQQVVCFATTGQRPGPYKSSFIRIDSKRNQITSLDEKFESLGTSPRNFSNAGVYLNRRGDVLLYDKYRSPLGAFHVYYLPVEGEGHVVAETGLPSPVANTLYDRPITQKEQQLGWGSWFGANGHTGNSFASVILNGQGQVAMLAGFRGAQQNDSYSYGLFASAINGKDLQLIAKLGDEVMLPNGELTAIQSIIFAGDTGNDDSRSSGMNETGELVFTVELDNGNVALLRSTRVAGDRAQPLAKREPTADELSQHRVDAMAALENWNAVAQRMLQKRKQRVGDSDARKIKQMADDLRTEYAEALEQWDALSSDTTISHAERSYRKQQIQPHLAELETTWETLGFWPFNPTEEPPSEQQRAFEFQTKLLLSTYGDVDEVTHAVEATNKQLEQLTADPIEFVATNHDLDDIPFGLFLFAGRGKTPKVFSHRIGPTIAVAPPADLTIAHTLPPNPGPFASHRRSITPLVRFVPTSEGTLMLDRQHWIVESKADGYTSNENRITLVDGLIKKYNVSDHLAYSNIRRSRGFPGSTVVELCSPATWLFNKLAKKSRTRTSSSGGGGGGSRDRFDCRFHNREMSGKIRGTPTAFSLALNEKVSPNRRMQLDTDDDSGTLSFTIETENEILHVTQQSDGTVRMIAGPLEEIVTLSANDFSSLYRQHPDNVERLFIYRCRQFGIGGLPMRADHAVQQTVLRRLKTLEAEDQRTRELIAQLGSENFDKWFTAQQELKLDFAMHEDAIRTAQKDKSTDAVARERLKTILAERSEQDSPTDWIIRELKLLNDVDYLKALPAEGDAAELVQRRLQSLQ